MGWTFGDVSGWKIGSETGKGLGYSHGHNGAGDELERNEHTCAGPSGSDDGECCGYGWRSGEQCCELYGYGSCAEHHEFESDVRIGWKIGVPTRRSSERDAGNKQRQVQWHNSDGDELERDEHSCAGASGSDDGECCGYGGRSGERCCELYGYGSCPEHHEFESDVRIDWNIGDDCGSELWSNAGNKQRQVQWHNSDGDELERDEHCCAGASGSDDGECCGYGGRSGKQRRELYGHSSCAEHHELESGFGIGGRVGDDRGSELWSNAGNKQRQVQWHNSDGDELERDEHSCAGASGSDDGECCGYGGRSGEQCCELYGYGSCPEHHEFESDVRIDWNIGDDCGCELWSNTGNEHSNV